MKKYRMAPLSGHQLILTWIMIPLFGIIFPLFFGCMTTVPVLIGSAFAPDDSLWAIMSYCFVMGGIVLMMPIWFTVLFLYRPLGLKLTNDKIIVQRHLSPYIIRYKDIATVQYPSKLAYTRLRWWGQWRYSGGLFGTFGIIKTKDGKDYHMFLTDDRNMIKLTLFNGQQFIISPNDPKLFTENLMRLKNRNE